MRNTSLKPKKLFVALNKCTVTENQGRRRPKTRIPLVRSSLVAYMRHMIEVRQTLEFQAWRYALRDDKARAAIARRVLRVQAGNFGDLKYLGEGVSELRIDYGPGYRLYLHRRGDILVVLLGGGDKRSQDADIARAKHLAAELEL